jgi:Spy/CpxP family protein refolding chaperone
MKLLMCTALLCLLFTGCAKQMPPGQLNDPKQRAELYATIIGDHELMKSFLEQAKESDHARMMVSHIMGGDSAGMDHENCPMNDSQKVTPASKSPYAGEESRAIKSLSDEDIKKYRSGEGMGQAKVAEMNHYPGPRHVLQVASQLQLSGEQKAQAERLYDVMHEKAVKLGEEIVEREKRLSEAFSGGGISRNELVASVTELGRLQGELRAAHLEAHLGMKGLLTAAQIRQYDELRGYHGGGEEHQHQQ